MRKVLLVSAMTLVATVAMGQGTPRDHFTVDPLTIHGPQCHIGQVCVAPGNNNDSKPWEIMTENAPGHDYGYCQTNWTCQDLATCSECQQGPPGPKGDKGDQGIQGIQGIQGLKGDTGAKGDKGDRGDTGAQGETGPAGPAGGMGAAGPMGPQGLTGPTGPSGECGCVGLYPTTLAGDWSITPREVDPCAEGFASITCEDAKNACSYWPTSTYLRGFTVALTGDMRAMNNYVTVVYLKMNFLSGSDDHSIVLHRQTYGTSGNNGDVFSITFPGRGIFIPAGWFVYPEIQVVGTCLPGRIGVDTILYTETNDAIVQQIVKLQ